ncbi:MAG: hypothetical protein ABIJ96_09205 [Elusimicrobiota bacterium]
MTRGRLFLPLAVLLAAGCAAAPVRTPAGKNPEDAAVRRAAIDAAWSLKYYLGRYGLAPELAAGLEPAQAKTRSGNPTIRELIRRVEEGYAAGSDAAGRAALAEAGRRTLRYFGRPDVRLFAPFIAGASTSRELREGWPEEIAAADPADLPMEDARGYADSRLGALGALASSASEEGLRIAASPAADVPWPPHCAAAAPRLLNFPGTTNGFRARFSACREGGYALVLDGFANRSLYLHELALLKVLLAGAAPRVFRLDDHAPRSRDDLLLAPFMENSGLPRRFDVLALGYYDELKEELAPAAQLSGEGWRAFTVRVATTTLVAVAVEDSWYGESLGASIARLVESGVEFETLYFAGSAGALTYLPPYSLAYPACYLSRAGERLDIPNELSGDARPPCHIAVESPLLETRRFLRRAAALADTVDVEGFALAKAAADKGLRLGTAYLITDYPEPQPVLKHHRLAETRAVLRHAGARAYAKRLKLRLEAGERAYRHPLEEALQRPLADFSSPAVAEMLDALRPLSAIEKAFVARVSSSNPPVLFRTWAARFALLAEDGLALSPKQVAGLKGASQVKTGLIPAGEDALYGAADYLFAGAGQNDWAEMYGPIVVHLSSAAWKNSFATRRSGANLLGRMGIDPQSRPAGEQLSRARQAFAEDAVVAADYGKALAALAVAGYREQAQSRERLRLAAESADDALWRLIDEETDAYLEAKIFRSFPLAAVTCVEIGAADKKELEARLGAQRAAALPLRPPGGCPR